MYLADDVKHYRKVAIKVLKPELAAVLGAERDRKGALDLLAWAHGWRPPRTRQYHGVS